MEAVLGATTVERRATSSLTRPVWSFAAYRAVAGVAIAAYFWDHYAHSAELISDGGLFDPGALPAGALLTRDIGWLTGLSASYLRAFFGACSVAALGMALGLAPRLLSAALLFVTASVGRALLPVRTLDDWLVATTLFLMVLSPPVSLSFVRRSDSTRLPDGIDPTTTLLVLSHTALGYVLLGSGLLVAGSPHWQGSRFIPLACSVAPFVLLLSGTGAAWVGRLLQLCLLVALYRATGSAVTTLLLLAASLVVWAPVAREPISGRARLGASVTIGMAYLGLVAVVQLAPHHLPDFTRVACRQILVDGGLLPLVVGHPLPPTPRSFTVRLEGHPSVTERPADARRQLLLDGLLESSTTDRMTRALLVKLLTPTCRTTGGSERGIFTVFSGDRSFDWSFSCDGSGVAAETVTPFEAGPNAGPT